MTAYVLFSSKTHRIVAFPDMTTYQPANELKISSIYYINMENSERDGNTRPPNLPLEKPVCRSVSNS